MNLENDKASIFGNEVELHCTSAGHCCTFISSPEMLVGKTFQVLFTMEDKDKGEKGKVIKKFHRQFAHPTSNGLKLLLKVVSSRLISVSCQLISVGCQLQVAS